MAINALAIIVESIPAQLGDDNVDHPNAYTSRKLNNAKKSYSMTNHEALGMIFSLQNFWHYFLEIPFIF